MASRRITKTMAEEAANAMGAKVYKDKLQAAGAKIDEAVEKIARKYIPAPVIACVGEYKSYFSTSNAASCTTLNDRGYRENYITGKLSFPIPSNSTYITVNREEYNVLNSLSKRKKQIENEKETFIEQMYDALVALKYDKNVEKELPEAMQYINFPEVKAVPMPVFTGLRDILAKANK